jgi:hypothetical protein
MADSFALFIAGTIAAIAVVIIIVITIIAASASARVEPFSFFIIPSPSKTHMFRNQIFQQASWLHQLE